MILNEFCHYKQTNRQYVRFDELNVQKIFFLFADKRREMGTILKAEIKKAEGRIICLQH